MIAPLFCSLIIMLLVHCELLVSVVVAQQLYVTQGCLAVIRQLTKLVDGCGERKPLGNMVPEAQPFHIKPWPINVL